MVSLKEAALRYASKGVAVFPLFSYNVETGLCECGNPNCSSPAKHPRFSGGFHNASTDLAQVENWWSQYPSANIGISTGEKSGLFVLDIDPRHGGDRSYDRLLTVGEVPKTWQVETGGDGRHLYFKYPAQPLHCRTGFLPGLDLKAEGGYIVAPPSIHKSGKTYQCSLGFSPEELVISEAPNWFLKVVGQTLKIPKSKLGEIVAGTRNEALFSLAGTLRAKGVAKDEIETQLQIINKLFCEPPLESTEVHKITEGVQRYSPGSVPQEERKWSTPQEPAAMELLEAPELPIEMIPRAFREWILDASKNRQNPVEYMAVSALIAAANLLGAKISMRPKKNDSWLVLCNFWGLLVGSPGFMKSPSMFDGLFAILRRDRECLEDFKEAMAAWKEGQTEARETNADLKFKLQKESRKENPDENIIKNLQGQLDREQSEAGDKPIEVRYILNDATIEALQNKLALNPNGLLFLKDEVLGFLKALGKQGQEGARAFILECWNGLVRNYSIDRVSRESVLIPRMRVSVFGTIQPGPLRDYFKDSVKIGSDGDGLLQRFQLMVYPRELESFVYTDDITNKAARETADRVFQNLDDFEPAKFGASPFDEDSELPYIRFSDEAQELFRTWLTELELEIRSTTNNLSPAFVAHLSKYRSLMPGLALLFHCIDVADGGSDTTVSLANARLAASWCEFLRAHAARIYSLPQLEAATNVAKLAEMICKGDILTGTTVRDIYRACRSGLRDKESVEAGLRELESLGWLRLEKSQGKGHPSFQIILNPMLAGGKNENPLN